MKLTDAIDALCIATKADGRSSRTVGSYQEKLKPLLLFLGDVDIESVTIHDLRRYVADLYDRGLSPFTVKSRVRALKRLFNFLVAEAILTENPTERIKTPNPKQKEPKAIRWEDFLSLLGTTKEGKLIDLRDRAIILFLFDSGCRVGGLCRMTVGDVDLERQRAIVTEKGEETRVVFFLDQTAEALTGWLAVRPECETDALFITLGRPVGKPLQTQGVARMLKRRGKRGSCEGPVNPHSFRHGFARQYLMNGGDLGTLADLLGHSDVQVTKLYYSIFTVNDLQQKHGQHSPMGKLKGGKNEK